MTALALADVVDFSTFPPGRAAVDLTNRRVRGARAVLEWIVRAWMTPPGSLPWAPTRGFDILALENGDFTIVDLYNIKARLEQEARLTMFVQAASVVLTLQAGTLSIDASITLVDGVTYPLGVKIDVASIALAANLPMGDLVQVAFPANSNTGAAAA